MKKNKILNIVKWLWLLIVLLGAGYYFVSHREMVVHLINNISVLRLLLSVFSLLIAKMLIGEIVRLSVETEGWEPPYQKILGIYSITSLGKYLPGGVWHFVGRFSTYRLNDMTNKQTTKAMIIENVWLISSAVAVGSSFYSLFQFDWICKFLNIPYQKFYSYLVAAFIAFFWIIGLALFNHLFCAKKANRIFLLGKLILVSLLIWSLIGLSFVLLFNEISLKLVGLSVGGYALSWAVGYVAVFAPGGIGIREAVLAAVFSVFAPSEQIAVYAAMNRVVWVISEVLLGLFFLFQDKDFLNRKDVQVEDVEYLNSNKDVITSGKPE